jgi:hypothetical protein
MQPESPGIWEAPAIEILQISATADSSGYNADYKGPHLNLAPESVSPPAFKVAAKNGHIVSLSVPDRGEWQAPSVTALSIAAAR